MSFIPGIPQNVRAAPEDTSINIAWSPSAPANSLAVTYHVKRSLVSGGPYTQVGTTSGITFTDSGLTNGTSYFYVVAASNSEGTSSDSSETFAVPQLVGQHDWQQELEFYLAAGPSALSMALCTEGPDAELRILLNKIERARFTPLGHYRMHPLFPPNTPHIGDQWNDTIQQTFIDYPAHIKQARVGALFTQLSSVTVGNTTGEMSLTGSGIGTLTLPPRFFVAGKHVRMRATGFYSSTGAADLTFKFKIDNELITGTISPLPAATDKVWRVEIDLTCQSAGTSGAVIGQGFFFYDDKQLGLPNLVPTVFDTTLIGHTDLTAEWSAAAPGDTITCTNITYEVIN